MDKDMAASFLNSVLNQLNWAFSEFIGMIQEVSRPPSHAPTRSHDSFRAGSQRVIYYYASVSATCLCDGGAVDAKSGCLQRHQLGAAPPSAQHDGNRSPVS